MTMSVLISSSAALPLDIFTVVLSGWQRARVDADQCKVYLRLAKPSFPFLGRPRWLHCVQLLLLLLLPPLP